MNECLQTWVAIAAIVEGFGSLGILVFTLYQVSCMKKELKQANVQTCFSIELELYEARRRYEDTSAELIKWKNEYESMSEEEQKKLGQRKIELTLAFNSSKEAYFSEVDRLCSYILSNKLSENDFCADWAPLIDDLYIGFKEEIEKKYSNIVSLHRRWGDKK